MKYYGKITDPKDLVTKEYVDAAIPENLVVASQTEIKAGDPLATGVLYVVYK